MSILRQGFKRHLPEELYEAHVWRSENDDRLEYSNECFENLAEEDVRIVLVLDEWEQVMAYPELNDWVEMLRSVGQQSLIGVITSTAYELVRLFSTASDLNRRFELEVDTSPFYNIFSTSYLGLMPHKEWSSLVINAFHRGGRAVDAKEVDLIGNLAGGHPLLTQLAGSLIWRARAENWNIDNIRQRFKHEAKPTFTEIWHKQTVPHQGAAIHQLLGIKGHLIGDDVFDEALEQLKMRGVVTESGNIFCQGFADFVLNLG